MDILTNAIQKTLWFIHTANLGGHFPSRDEIDAFTSTPQPKDEFKTNKLMTAALASLYSGMLGEARSPAEPVSVYLIKTHMIDVKQKGFFLSPLGVSLLKGFSEVSASLDIQDFNFVTLEPNSPLSAQELGRIADQAGSGMLVDSYFDTKDLPWLVEETSITRLLLGVNPKSKTALAKATKKEAEIAGFLAEISENRTLDIRRDQTGSLHDRAVIHESGKITMLGTSVNSVRKNLTTIITLPMEVAQGYGQLLEAKWSKAHKIKPSSPPSLKK